jgi:hypothetical protein
VYLHGLHFSKSVKHFDKSQTTIHLIQEYLTVTIFTMLSCYSHAECVLSPRQVASRADDGADGLQILKLDANSLADEW